MMETDSSCAGSKRSKGYPRFQSIRIRSSYGEPIHLYENEGNAHRKNLGNTLQKKSAAFP
jgi:hypothetical protein